MDGTSKQKRIKKNSNRRNTYTQNKEERVGIPKTHNKEEGCEANDLPDGLVWIDGGALCESFDKRRKTDKNNTGYKVV